MATSDYLPIATGGSALVDPQASFAGSGYQQNGFSNGIALPAQANKCWRQSSMVAAALTNWIVNVLGVDVPDDGNLANLIALLTSAFATLVNPTLDTATGNTFGITYTATEPRLIAASGEINLGVGHAGTLQALVNGVPVNTNGVTNSSGIASVTFMVSKGDTYRVNTGGIAPGDTDPLTLYSWAEWAY